MLKKISVVLCAGLFATAFAAGCKKDKKDDGAAAGATCDAVSAAITGHMMESMGSHGMDAKAMADTTKGITAALAKVCTDDKWSDDAKSCAMTAKDPKKECEGKLTEEQTAHLVSAAQTAMAAAMPAMGSMDDKMAKAEDGTVGVVGTTDGQAAGSGSGTGTSAAAPVAPGTYPATCQGVADRAKADIGKDLPPGMPAEITEKLSALIARVCTEDKWGQDVLDCGVTAADPKAECHGKLTADQSAHLDAEQDKLGKEIMEEMAKAGGGGGAGMAAGGSGIKECDEFMESIKKLVACDKVPADQKSGIEQMLGAFGALNSLPEDQKAVYVENCKQGTAGMAQMLTQYGC